MCVLQTVFCVVTVYLATLVWPAYSTFPQTETAILDVAQRIGGQFLFGGITFVLMVAALASALTGQAGASRLLLGMGRDGVISRRIFAYVSPRFSTPTRGIFVMGAISLFAALFMHFELAVELLNFGAFAGFILVNLSVVRHYWFRLGRRSGWEVATNLIFPLLGAAVCTYVWLSLSTKAQLAGFVWLAVGAIYLAVITGGFKRAPRSMESLAGPL